MAVPTFLLRNHYRTIPITFAEKGSSLSFQEKCYYFIEVIAKGSENLGIFLQTVVKKKLRKAIMSKCGKVIVVNGVSTLVSLLCDPVNQLLLLLIKKYPKGIKTIEENVWVSIYLVGESFSKTRHRRIVNRYRTLKSRFLCLRRTVNISIRKSPTLIISRILESLAKVSNILNYIDHCLAQSL